MRKSVVMFCGWILLLLSASSVVNAAQNTDAVSVCLVLESPASFNNKSLTINGVLRSEGRHAVVLFDNETDDAGIAIVIPDEIRDDEDVDRLLDLLYAHPEKGLIRSVYGKFQGIFHWAPGKVPARVLVLDKVDLDEGG